MFAVNIQAFGLAIGSIRSAQVRPFVPVEAEPLEVGDELIFVAGFAAFDIGVFDAQDHVPPFCRAKSQLNRAVRALPTWRWPVGEGAKRTRTGEFGVTRKMLADHHSPRRGRCPTCPCRAKPRDRAYPGDARKEQHQHQRQRTGVSAPHVAMLVRARRHVGSGDAVVPAELCLRRGSTRRNRDLATIPRARTSERASGGHGAGTGLPSKRCNSSLASFRPGVVPL